MATVATGHTKWFNVGYRFRMRLERVEVDVAGNRSRVRARAWMQSSGGSTGGYYYWGPISSWHGASIDGTTVVDSWVTRTLKASGETLILDNYRWVTHANDGTRSVSAGFSFENSWTGYMTGSLSLTLDTIPRTSSISTTGSFTTGTAKSLAWSPGSTAFRHDLHYRIGSGSWVSIASNQQSSYSWSPPHSIFQGDNSTSKTVTVRLTTKTSASGTSIGTTSKNFTVNLNSNQIPGVPSASFTEQNTTVASKFPGQVLQSKSQLKGTVSASTVLGATITSKTIRVGDTNYTEADSIRFNTSGTVPVTVTVVDSRGRSRSATANIEVRAYRDPQLTRFLARRCDPNGDLNPSGTSVRIDMTASASSVKPSSTELNKLKIVTKTRPIGGGTDTRHTRTDTGIAFDDWYVIPGGANYPVSQTFEIILEVTDEAHEGTPPQNIARVETDAVVMHWDNVGVGVGKYREQGVLDVGGDIYSSGARVLSHSDIEMLTLTTQNLNTFTSPGYRFQTATANATAARNYPSGGLEAGALEVIPNTAGNFLTQRYTTYSSKRQFVRTLYSGSWQAWVEIGATPPSASETVQGIVERATQAEVNTGTDTTRYVSPSRLRNRNYAPWATATGGYTSSLAVNNNTGRTITFTYPSGRFTIGPVLQCVPTSSARLQLAVTGSTTTTGTVRVDNFSGANVANLTWGVNWHATQHSSNSASG